MTYVGVKQRDLETCGKQMTDFIISLKFREFRGQDKSAASLWRAYGCLISIFLYGTFPALPCLSDKTEANEPFLRMAGRL